MTVLSLRSAMARRAEQGDRRARDVRTLVEQRRKDVQAMAALEGELLHSRREGRALHDDAERAKLQTAAVRLRCDETVTQVKAVAAHAIENLSASLSAALTETQRQEAEIASLRQQLQQQGPPN